VSKGSIMSVHMFSKLLAKCDLSPESKQYLPIWAGRYAIFSKRPPLMRLVVERELVMAFLRSLRDSGVPAWQRLQAVRAIECYRDVVLCCSKAISPRACIENVGGKLRDGDLSPIQLVWMELTMEC
jgi:hypothetical protein